MRTFKQIALNETINNLFTAEDKEKYVDEVWDLLIEAYKAIGGIKGSGFANKKDMIDKIKMWKIIKKDSKIIAGLMYKDKGMRKTVACFTDNSKEGKMALLKLLKDDLERSSIEVSHSLLNFLEKKLPKLVDKYVVHTSEVEKVLGKKIDIIDDRKYSRDINGAVITKMMLGNIKKFYE